MDYETEKLWHVITYLYFIFYRSDLASTTNKHLSAVNVEHVTKLQVKQILEELQEQGLIILEDYYTSEFDFETRKSIDVLKDYEWTITLKDESKFLNLYQSLEIQSKNSNLPKRETTLKDQESLDELKYVEELNAIGNNKGITNFQEDAKTWLILKNVMNSEELEVDLDELLLQVQGFDTFIETDKERQKVQFIKVRTAVTSINDEINKKCGIKDFMIYDKRKNKVFVNPTYSKSLRLT